MVVVIQENCVSQLDKVTCGQQVLCEIGHVEDALQGDGDWMVVDVNGGLDVAAAAHG